MLLVWVQAASAQRGSAQSPLIQPERIKVAMRGAGAFGGDVDLVTHLYKPAGAGPFPTVVFSHGRGSNEENRNLRFPIMVGHANFWLRKGFAVAAAIRPGYGETGGVDREAPGHTWRGGSCMGVPDFASTAKVAAQTVFVLMEWLRAQPWNDHGRMLLEGQSVGGLTTVAAASRNPDGVIGFINFSGGAGGRPDGSPRNSCRPELLRDLYGEFGKTTKVPSLWLYAENDLYWGPEAPREWHKAFAAGGSQTKFVMTPAVPGTEDGHRLLAVGGRLWSPHVNEFVKGLAL
jgi:dienelactone hydrolase